MAILSITVSVEDNKLLYIKKSEEEGALKFSCHHFTFDANNHAEVTLDENGVIKSVAPCRKSTSVESTSLSTSRSIEHNNDNLEVKFNKNSRGSVVIIDLESFRQGEIQSTPSSVPPILSSEYLEEKLIISMEQTEGDLKGLKLHVAKLVA